MDDFTLIHKPCGQPARLSYYTTSRWDWVEHEEGAYENETDQYDLALICDACDVRVEPEPAPR